MRQPSIFMFSAGVIVTAAVTLVVLNHRSSKPEPSTNSAEVEKLRAEVAQLREQQLEVSRGVGLALQNAQRTATKETPQVPADKPTTGVEQAAPAQQVDPEIQRQKDEELLDARIHHMAQVLEQEKSDPQWAPQALKVLEDGYSRPELSSIKHTARCGQTLCGVNISIAPGNNSANALRALASAIPWDAEVFFSFESNEKGVFYYARPGYQLPGADTTAS